MAKIFLYTGDTANSYNGIYFDANDVEFIYKELKSGSSGNKIVLSFKSGSKYTYFLPDWWDCDKVETKFQWVINYINSHKDNKNRNIDGE